MLRSIILGAALLALTASSASAAAISASSSNVKSPPPATTTSDKSVQPPDKAGQATSYSSSKSNTAGLTKAENDRKTCLSKAVDDKAKAQCAAIATSLSNVKSPPTTIKATKAPAGH